MSRITEAEGQAFVEISRSLEKRYIKTVTSDPWAGSPFAWIRGESSRRKGKIGELLVEEWLRSNDLDVSPTGDSEADRVVNGKRVEIKFSTLWEQGFYKFQQIRDQDYDYIICLGVSPDEVHCWVIPKDVARQLAPSQHAGKQGKDTAWLTVDPNAPPEILRQYGGSLEQALELIRRMSSK